MSGELVKPSRSPVSAPSDAPTPENAVGTRSAKSAPSDAPSPVSVSPVTGGNASVPTSIRSNVVAPIGPRKSGSDPRRERNMS